MAEYIDREMVKEIMQRYRCSDCTNDKSLDCSLCQLNRPFAEISEIPTADVQEVKRGRWILPRKKGCVIYDEVAYKECSECGEVTFLAKTKYSQMNYCPNCGAKMDGEEKK